MINHADNCKIYNYYYFFMIIPNIIQCTQKCIIYTYVGKVISSWLSLQPPWNSYAAVDVHGAMGCEQTNFTLVWRWHQLPSGFLPSGRLFRVSRRLDLELFNFPSYKPARICARTHTYTHTHKHICVCEFINKPFKQILKYISKNHQFDKNNKIILYFIWKSSSLVGHCTQCSVEERLWRSNDTHKYIWH